MTAGITRRDKIQEFCVAIGLSLFAMLLFYFSTKATLHDFDYTGRIASALLRGHLGLETRSDSWLKEMVLWEGKYYSVFPAGAVLRVVPRELGSTSFS